MVIVFWVSFLATIAALAAAIWSGRTARRRTHFVCVGVTLVLLTCTILLTESLMRAISFPRAELDFHLKFAMTATFLLLPVLVTGFGMARRGGRVWRNLHRIAVTLFLIVTLMATGTGIWVFTLAT